MAIDLSKYKLPSTGQQSDGQQGGGIDLSKYNLSDEAKQNAVLNAIASDDPQKGSSAFSIFTNALGGAANTLIGISNLIGAPMEAAASGINALTSSEQGLGETLGEARAVQGKDVTGAQQSQANLDDMDLQLAKTIATQKKAGKDTSDLETQLAGNLSAKGFNVEDIIPAMQKSGEQIAGETVGVLVDALSGGALETVGKDVAEKGITKIGVKQLAKEGAATGAFIGGTQNAASAMQQGESAGDVTVSGLGGAAVGAVVGAAGGAIAGAAGKPFDKMSEDEKALQAITKNPKSISADEYSDLVKEGKISPKTKTKPAQVILDKDEQKMAIKYKSLLQSQDPVVNQQNIANNLIGKSKDLSTYMKKIDKPVDTAKLSKNMLDELKKVKIMGINEDKLVQMVNDYQELIGNEATNYDVFGNRNAFRTPNTYTGNITDNKKLDQAARRGIQNYLKDVTPGIKYKKAMDEMSDMYDLNELIEPMVKSEKGKSGIGVWMKQNPGKTKALKWGLGIAGTGLVGKEALNMLK